jgi:hypothetical protein
MASKHAALYFEAYKQHHLVCSSLHTLSCEVSRVQGGGGGDNGRVPASSASSEFEAKGMCNKADLAKYTTTPASRWTMQMLYIFQTTSRCIALSCKCSFIEDDWYWASPMAVDCETDTHCWTSTHIFWTFSHTSTHAR